MTSEELTKLAVSCGATVYRYRLTPQSPALAFGDEAWAKFCVLVAEPPKLESIEQYRLQMAGILTAATGYWKEGDSIHPDYDTPALREVAKLYADYLQARGAKP